MDVLFSVKAGGSCNTAVEVVCKRGDKRKIDSAEGGPRRKRRLVTKDVEEEHTIRTRAKTKHRKDSASTSAVTGSCNTTVKVVWQRGDKRKVADDEEGPSRKRRQVTKDVENIEEEPTKQQEFEAKYKELDHIGQGGSGSVFAGHRRADNLPVAIKHIPNENVWFTHEDNNGNTISIEVAIMLKLSAESEGTSPYASLLDWYQMERELVLVMERPIHAKSFWSYLRAEGVSMTEEEVKIILRQLVDVALDLKRKDIFHRDIKTENMLIQTCSDVPRVLLIDFGMSCYDEGRLRRWRYFGTVPPPEIYTLWGYTAEPTTVFQIGAVLFDALHEEKNEFDTIRFFTSGQSLPKGMSKDCDDFLQMCLKKYPINRPTLEQLRNHQWLR
ncbi:serine/threonine-protein kinase pim-1-like [Pungitius pungitius]|uniref:serine/threonine-protein kinase pim-1-like n=1 Tax=Pungitius pungitius TaxID=134920 RepID=UPI002E0E967F